MSKTFCITGISGFIALHIAKQLLSAGYSVHGTVRSLSNPAKIAPLTRMQAEYPDKLKLFEADLLLDGSFDEAVKGCDGCFHTASPFFAEGVTGENAMEKLVNPALQGTKNVLVSCNKVASIKRVVVTSSFAAVFNPSVVGGEYDESCWNTVSKAETGGFDAYRYSKVCAERYVWDFVKENKPGFDAVAINPPLVVGENLGEPEDLSTLNTSSKMILNYLAGTAAKIADGGLGFVDVVNVAETHIKAMLTPEAHGRYLCSAASMSWIDVADIIRQNFPDYPVPTEAVNPNVVRPIIHNKRCVEELGIKFIPPEEFIVKQCNALIALGLAKPSK